MLISEVLNNAVCAQIGHELYNANLYLYIAGVLKNKGLDKIAKIFEEQQKEELAHSKEFFDLLTDLNAPVVIPVIEGINLALSTPLEIARVYLRQEILTTTKINDLKQLSIEEENPVVEEKMREMITKQQAEYEEATGFMDKVVLLPEWWQMALWDASL